MIIEIQSKMIILTDSKMSKLAMFQKLVEIIAKIIILHTCQNFKFTCNQAFLVVLALNQSVFFFT